MLQQKLYKLYARLAVGLDKSFKRAKKHWLLTLVVAVFVFSAGVQSTTWLIESASVAYEHSIGWKGAEMEKLDLLGPGEQIGYIKSILGEPLFRDGGDEYREYVFKRRFGYVQVVADNSDKAVLYSIVVCSDNFKPTVQFANREAVVLNHDTLDTRGSGDTYYSISGATANSFLMEGGYGGNPSNYQEYYVGASDSCGYLNAPIAEAYDLLESQKCASSNLGLQGFTQQFCSYDISLSSIANLRKKIKINTVVVTAPHVSLKDLRPIVQFGPDRIQLRALPNYRSQWG